MCAIYYVFADGIPLVDAVPTVEVPVGTVPLQGVVTLGDWHYHPDLADINSTLANAYAAAICAEVCSFTASCGFPVGWDGDFFLPY